jgi:hypothetical protein
MSLRFGLGEMFILVLLVLIWLVPVILAGVLASKRGGNGPLWGLIAGLAGPLAWVVLLLAVVLNPRRL